MDRFLSRVFEMLKSLASHSRRVLLRTVKPLTSESLPLGKSPRRMDPRPVPRPGYESLLAAVREQVSETIDLRSLFLADDNRLIPASPDLFFPIVESTHFSSQVGIDVIHETRQLKSVLYTQKKMVVVGEEDEGMEFDGVVPLSPCQYPKDDDSQLFRGFEKESTLNRPTGHLHQGAV